MMAVVGNEATHCDLLFPDAQIAMETGDAVLFRGRDGVHGNGPLQGGNVDPDTKRGADWKRNRISVAFYVK